MKREASAKRRRTTPTSRPRAGAEHAGEATGSLEERITYTETAPVLTGGDVDAGLAAGGEHQARHYAVREAWRA